MFVVGGQELRGFFFVRLPAFVGALDQYGVGGSLRGGLFRSEHGGEF